jgi:hypothetical protein
VIAPQLRLQPGQPALTPEQEREAERFAEALVEAQLSTEPVDEPETEALLTHAYEVAGLAPPQRIEWVDGPLQLVALFPPRSTGGIKGNVWDRVEGNMLSRSFGSLEAHIGDGVRTSVRERVWGRIAARMDSLWDHVRESLWTSLAVDLVDRPGANTRVKRWSSPGNSVGAYEEAPALGFYRYFDVYLAPNRYHALAHFNERVSCYWVGEELAIIVRRPKVLTCDEAGHLHSATGRCVEYRDGWGFYAWHGVRVSERIICAPQTLTRQDFLQESNVEVRRIIQERMGERFVREMRGKILDQGSRGTLYQVKLPRDPERVAHYVQVQDTTTLRQYFLRVPPTIQTAAEAVAWSFQRSVEEYRPTQET